MATITPAFSSPAVNIQKVVWETLTTGDTATAWTPAGLMPLFGAIQVTGTFGGATVVLQGTCDGTNWVTVKDKNNAEISLTSAGAFEFATAMLSLRPLISGGTSDDVDVTIICRNQ